MHAQEEGRPIMGCVAVMVIGREREERGGTRGKTVLVVHRAKIEEKREI
jgi:hypothetical protein